jgi:ABC-type anion transport system duplicated permease subunit
VTFVVTAVTWHEAISVFGLGALTLLRVVVVVALAALVWTPIGTWIGMSPRIARFAQPVVQVTALFPATFLFPLFTVVALSLADELLSLPRMIFGGEHLSNWREAAIQTLVVLVVATPSSWRRRTSSLAALPGGLPSRLCLVQTNRVRR